MQVTKAFTFTGHSGSIYALAEGFSPGTVLSGSSDKFVAAWNVIEGTQENFAAQFPAPVYSLLTVKEKNLLLAGTGAGSVHVIDIAKKEEAKILQLHASQIFDLAYSPKHDLLITAGADGQISISHLNDPAFLKAGKLCEEKVRSVAIDPKENLLAVACGDGTIRIYNLPDVKEIFAFPAHELSANVVRWHPEGNYLLSGGRDAFLKSWDPQNGFALTSSIPAHNFAIYSIVFSPDKKLFATASRDKTIKLWNADEVKFLLRINKEHYDGHVNSVNRLLWQEAGLISAGDDRSVMVWKVSGE